MANPNDPSLLVTAYDVIPVAAPVHQLLNGEAQPDWALPELPAVFCWPLSFSF